MAILESMTLALAGQYNVDISFQGGKLFNYTYPDGSNITLSPVTTSDDNYDPFHRADQGPTIASSGPQNGTIISSTTISQRVYHYNISDNEGPDLVINQDILNEML